MNQADKVDRRVRRTHRLLGEALIALATEKGYEAVTIKDITERADVAYVTFFRHYRDKDELLSRIADDFVAEIEAITREADMMGEGLVIFRHVRDHLDFYRLILTSGGAHRVYERFRASIIDHLNRVCGWLHDGSSPLPPEIAAHHIASALIAQIEWWVQHDLPYSPERMAEIYEYLLLNPVVPRVGGRQAK